MNTQSLAAQQESQSLRRRLSRYAPLVFWMLFISFASTSEFSAANSSKLIRPIVLWLFPDINKQSLAQIHFVVRKVAHFLEFAALGLLAGRAFYMSSHQVLRVHWVLWAILLVVSYALLDEYHQSFVPSRSASIYDSFIDMAGGFTALVLYRIWTLHRENRNRAGEEIRTVTG
jgi:VanZ family protein